MVSQHGILLAVSIISDQFGPFVSKVLGCLLRHGPLSLQEVVRRVALSSGQVKNSLLVLIQHNCVQAFSTPRGKQGNLDRSVTLYLAIFDNVLHRLRFSKFLSVIRADIPESETLVEGLLQNGRLTFDQLVERTISKIPEGKDKTVPTREEIRNSFNRLVYAHYVERCPKPEPHLDQLADEQPTSSRKRPSKIVEKVLSLEQKVVYTAALSDAERFSEIPYFIEGSSNSNDCHHQSVAGAKRKHESLEDEEHTIIADNAVLWRANFEKLIFCLKKKFCAERKKAKLKLGTHSIWEAFLEANVDNDNNSVCTSPINGILEKLQQKEGGSSMTLDQVTGVLNDLECASTSANPEEFTFDLSKFAETCRNDEIESLVKKKYGQEAYIIFRLLVKAGLPIETDQITDMTILDKLKVHETLYKLWQDEYIDSEKVSATGNTNYFVWRVKSKLQEQFIDRLYHAALNLRQMANNMVELQLEGSKDKTKLQNRKSILILALIRLDESLMLFHDF